MSSGTKVDDITQSDQRHIRSPVPAAFREPPAAMDPAWIRQRKQKRVFLQARHVLEDLLKHMEAYIRGHVERHQARKYLPDPAVIRTPHLPVLVKLFGLESEYSACSYLIQRHQGEAQSVVKLGASEDWSVRVRDRRLEVNMGVMAVADVKLACMMELGDIKLWLSELSKRECDNPGDATWATYREELVKDFETRLDEYFMGLHSIDREQNHDAFTSDLSTCGSCYEKKDRTGDGTILSKSVGGSQPRATHDALSVRTIYVGEQAWTQGGGGPISMTRSGRGSFNVTGPTDCHTIETTSTGAPESPVDDWVMV
jgi:hypothetical protein